MCSLNNTNLSADYQFAPEINAVDEIAINGHGTPHWSQGQALNSG